MFSTSLRDSDYVTTPSVSPDGKAVYVASGTKFRYIRDGEGYEDMTIHALHANNGQHLWSFNASLELEKMPCCSSHRSTISRPILSPDGTAVYFRAGLGFFGLRTTDGGLKFSWNMFDKMVGNPTMSPDSRTLYVASLSYEDKVICALDVTRNISDYYDWQQCRWLHRTWSTTSPVASPDGTSIYYGSQGGNATALSSLDGSLKWGFNVYADDVGEIVPSYDGSAVYFAYMTSDAYFALNASSGEKLWEYHDLSTSTTPAVSPDGKTLYVTFDGNGAEVRAPDGKLRPANSSIVALDARTGREKWRFNTTMSEVDFRGTPVATTDTIFIGSSHEGTFWALRAEDGSVKFNFCLVPSADFASAAATLSPDLGTIFVASKTGLYALDTRPAQQVEPCPDPNPPKPWHCYEFTAPYDDPKNLPDPIHKGYVYHFNTTDPHDVDPEGHRVSNILRGPCPLEADVFV